jgi:ribosomal protein S5
VAPVHRHQLSGRTDVFARIVIVGNEVGVLAFTTTSAGQEEAAIDRLVDRLSGLELGAI